MLPFVCLSEVGSTSGAEARSGSTGNSASLTQLMAGLQLSCKAKHSAFCIPVDTHVYVHVVQTGFINDDLCTLEKIPLCKCSRRCMDKGCSSAWFGDTCVVCLDCSGDNTVLVWIGMVHCCQFGLLWR